ncbi:MAG TPA: hypothetical protein GX505_13170 [Clostridiales bacterium]|nr:hypothetical protein [Clostridiales bacterium]
MAVIELARLVSGTNTQASSVDRSDACLKAIRKLQNLSPTQDAVLIGNVPRVWPELQKYENDNSGANTPSIFWSVPSPQFVWDDDSFEGGEIRYFAQAFKIESLDEHTIFVAVFADNAHRLFIEERTGGNSVIKTFNPKGGFEDGLMVASASFTDDTTTPFNWQKIRLWSSDDIRPVSTDNYLVFSFEVLNYDTTDTLNPAGLAYFIDIYRRETD